MHGKICGVHEYIYFRYIINEEEERWLQCNSDSVKHNINVLFSRLFLTPRDKHVYDSDRPTQLYKKYPEEVHSKM